MGRSVSVVQCSAKTPSTGSAGTVAALRAVSWGAPHPQRCATPHARRCLGSTWRRWNLGEAAARPGPDDQQANLLAVLSFSCTQLYLQQVFQ